MARSRSSESARALSRTFGSAGQLGSPNPSRPGPWAFSLVTKAGQPAAVRPGLARAISESDHCHRRESGVPGPGRASSLSQAPGRVSPAPPAGPKCRPGLCLGPESLISARALSRVAVARLGPPAGLRPASQAGHGLPESARALSLVTGRLSQPGLQRLGPCHGLCRPSQPGPSVSRISGHGRRESV